MIEDEEVDLEGSHVDQDGKHDKARYASTPVSYLVPLLPLSSIRL